MEKSPNNEGFSKSERKGNSSVENFPNRVQDFPGENLGINVIPEQSQVYFPHFENLT